MVFFKNPWDNFFGHTKYTLMHPLRRDMIVCNVQFQSHLWYYKVLFVSSPNPTATPAPIWIRAYWLRAQFKRLLVSLIIFLMKKVRQWDLWHHLCLSDFPGVNCVDNQLHLVNTYQCRQLSVLSNTVKSGFSGNFWISEVVGLTIFWGIKI